MLSRRDWRTEAVLSLVAGILILLVAFGTLFALLSKPLGLDTGPDRVFWQLLVGLVSLQAISLVLVHFFLKAHGRTWRDGFSLAGNGTAWKWGLSVAAASVLVGYPLEYGVYELLRRMGSQPEPQVAVQFLTSAPNWQRAIIGFLAVVPAALAEESVFRGVIYSAGRDHGYRWIALVGSALLFGLAHAHKPAFLPLAFFGAALAWAYERTGNLATCYIAHAAYNLVGLGVAISGLGGDGTT